MRELSKTLKMEILKQYLMESQDYTEEDFLQHGERWLEDVLIVNEEERDKEFEEYQYNLIDDLGLEAFSKHFQEWILNNCIKKDWFEDAQKENWEYYIEDIREEGNRLAEEMAEAGAETEEDFLQQLIDGEGDSIEAFRFNYGDDVFSKVVKENNLINWEKVIEEIKEWDGYSCLASYDGMENEYYIDGELYFLYRQN